MYAQPTETQRLTNDDALTIVAYELRSQLNSIIAWARVLRSSGLDQEVWARAAEAVERNAYAQARIVEGLLEVARIASGATGPRVLPVEIGPVVGSAVDAVRNVAEGRGVRVFITRDHAAETVAGDYECVRHVVRSVVSAAVASAPGGASVHVTLASAGPNVEIAASYWDLDADPGDSPAERRKAVRPRECIGLAIARRLAELHGGSVHVERDGGSERVSITASLPVASPPLAASEAGGVEPADVDPGESRPRLSGMRVLIVSGEAERRTVLAGVLTAFNAEVRTASSFEEAIRAVAGWASEC